MTNEMMSPCALVEQAPDSDILFGGRYRRCARAGAESVMKISALPNLRRKGCHVGQRRMELSARRSPNLSRPERLALALAMRWRNR